MFATSPTLAKCRYPGCPKGIVRQISNHWQCDACKRLSVCCDHCSTPNRAEAPFCTSCGKRLPTLLAFGWKTGLSEPKDFSKLAWNPGSDTVLRAYAGHVLAAGRETGHMSLVSALTPTKAREIPAYGQSGSRLTSPILMDKFLYWGSENGLWQLHLHRLHNGESPENAAPTPVSREIRAIAAHEHHLFWLSWDLAGLYIEGDSAPRSVPLPGAENARLIAVGEGLAAVLHPRMLYVIQLQADGELSAMEVSVAGINDAADPLLDLIAMTPSQLLAVYQKRLAYLFIDPAGEVRVSPVTQRALRESNFFSAHVLRGEEGTKTLLVTREGWTQLDPISGFKDYHLLDRGSCEFLQEYKLGYAFLEVVHVQQGRTFLELHTLGGRTRKCFIERPNSMIASTFDERFVYVLGKKDGQNGVWIYDLCARP